MQGAPTGGLDLVDAWRERFRTGSVDELAWLMTRPFTYDASGSASSARPRDLWSTVDLASALSSAFPDWRLVPDRVEVREHRVVMDVELRAWHTGPLDLRAFGDGVYPSTGRSLRLPRQRVAWDLVHQRVHRFEVVDGPGLGLDLILDRLGLASSMARTGEAAARLVDEASPAAPVASREDEAVVRVEARDDADGDPALPLSRRVDLAVKKRQRLTRRHRLFTRARAQQA